MTGAEAPRLAVTIDDLPWSGPPYPGGVMEGNERILAVLADRNAPAAGFVVCDRIGPHAESG